MITRRGALTGILAAGLGTALAGCTRKDSGPTPTIVDGDLVTIGLTYIPNVQFSPFYVATKQGMFEAEKVRVELRHHGQQEEVFGALLRGKEQVVFASADEAMVAASTKKGIRGQSLATFATAYQTYPIEVLGLEPAADLSALKGATLGIPGHYGSSYYAALAAIHRAGLTERDVKLVDIGYTQLTALTTGKVDFIMGFRNNELVQLKAQGRQVSSLPISDVTSPQLVGPSLVVASDRGPDKSVLARIAKVMKNAEAAIVADPQVAIDATADHVPALADKKQQQAARGVLEATMEMWKKNGKPSVAVDQEAFTRMGEFLKTAGIIEEPPVNPVLSLL